MLDFEFEQIKNNFLLFGQKTYRSHSMAKRIPAASVGAPIDERTVTTRTILELGMLGTARDAANVSNLKQK